MYDIGEGTKIDEKQAFYWYQKSAEQDDIEAQYLLALTYLEMGTDDDKKRRFTG